MTDHIVWTMGRWRVVRAQNGLLIQRQNVFGAVIWTSELYTGWQSQKRAIADAKQMYAKDAG